MPESYLDFAKSFTRDFIGRQCFDSKVIQSKIKKDCFVKCQKFEYVTKPYHYAQDIDSLESNSNSKLSDS